MKLQNYLGNLKNVLVIGKSGTGKTYITQEVLKSFSKDNFSKLFLSFTGTTTVRSLRGIIDRKYRKTSKNNFIPKKKEKMIFFIDDISMPKQDLYGSQPPIEFLRMLVENDFIYDLKRDDKPIMKILNTMYISAMTTNINSKKVSKRFISSVMVLPFKDFGKDDIF